MVNEYFEISMFNIPILNIKKLLECIGCIENKVISSQIYDCQSETDVKYAEINDLTQFLKKNPHTITLSVSSIDVGLFIQDVIVSIRPIKTNNDILFADLVLNFGNAFFSRIQQEDLEKLKTIMMYLLSCLEKTKGEFIRFGYENAYFDADDSKVSTLMEFSDSKNLEEMIQSSLDQIYQLADMRTKKK